MVRSPEEGWRFFFYVDALSASMDIDELGKAFGMFITTVAFVTTNGRDGPNVMAAEWTFNVSRKPFLVSVHIGPRKATHDAISEKGEFGVSLVAEDQIDAMGFAGHFTRRETDKLSSELFETYPARKIDVPMIKGCPLNLECRLVQKVAIGDHVAFIGEVIDFSVDPSKKPVAYRRGAYRLGDRFQRIRGLAVAVTPSRCVPESQVVIEGELTCEDRAQKDVHFSLEPGDGERYELGSARTDDDGFFLLEVRLPSQMKEGSCRILARREGNEGAARLVVTHS